MIPLSIQSIAEATPGPVWRAHFEGLWPGYRAWFTRGDTAARPALAACRAALARHMPELVPAYERLAALAGEGAADDAAARMLTLWRPPPFLTGCSQAVWMRGPRPGPLVRNYDYAPGLFEGVLMRTAYTRPVLGMSDCLWGLLDGVNDAGLCAALAFGGRDAIGEGFGIPLVLRYVLETCTTTGAACATLARVPVHMAYNVAVVDAAGDYASVQVGPDRAAVAGRDAVTTNHQQAGDGPTPRRRERRAREGNASFAARYARATATHERACVLRGLLEDPAMTAEALAERFLQPPLYARDWERGFGTLYSAVYDPAGRGVSLRWPGGVRLEQSIGAFATGAMTVEVG